MKTSLLLCLALACCSIARADVLGTTVPEITFTDGSRLQEVRLLRASASARTVTISTNRHVRNISLDRFPERMRHEILRECSRDHYTRERNVIPSPVTVVRTTDASEPVRPSAAASAPVSFIEPSGGLAQNDLKSQAAKLAPDELLMYLQKTFQRVSALDCIIRTNEKIPGWQQLRVGGTASFSMWDNYRRDYVRRVARFEVEFEILNGEKLRANSVTFDGITGRIEP